MAEPDLASADLDFNVGPFLLSPLSEADAAGLFAHLSDPAVVEFMDIDVLERVEDARNIIHWAERLRDDGLGVRWTIRDRAGAMVGTAGFNAFHLERGSRGEVAYDLARAWWGRGVMHEILPFLIDFGFGRLGLHRLEAMVTPGNVRSCRVLERHGFAREGVLRGYGYWKDAWFDQIVYGRITAR